MKVKSLLFAVVLLYGCMSALAQQNPPQPTQEDPPRFDIFGGYSHVGNFDIGLNGWIASANFNLNRWLGIEADVSGHYGSESLGAAALVLPGVPTEVNSHMHNFNVGPSATYRRERYNAFGHFLLGVSNTNVNAASADEGDTSFSWALGGGADYNFTPSWAARFQVDLLRTNFFDRGDSHGRIAVGLVYRLGR